MEKHDWSVFCKRINIKCSKQEAYDAWASQEKLESWFLRSAVFLARGSGEKKAPGDILQQGDRYEWMWHGWSDEVLERGAVLVANGQDLFRFSFGDAGNVTVSIASEDGETIVELKQDEIPVDDSSRVKFHIGCLAGWTFYLANLKSILEGGLDLRNKNMKIASVVNA